MLDNNSTTSLTSIQDERPERKRHQVWRKPVPPYTPDPPKKSLLANPSALRRMAQFTSGDDRPPLPPDWRENIENAQRKETLDVERPSSPTPDSTSNVERASSHGVTKSKGKLPSSKSRVEKALPKVPGLEANQQNESDCGAAGAASTKSMKLETAGQSSVKNTHSHRAQSMPSIKPRSTPPPPACNTVRRGENTNASGHRGVNNTPYCIVYPRGLGTNSIDTTRRHVAVFPVSSGSNTDLSVNATVVDSREDVRSTCNLRNSSSIPSLLKPGASSVLMPSERCEPFTSVLERRRDSFCGRVKHAFRGCFHPDATTHKY